MNLQQLRRTLMKHRLLNAAGEHGSGDGSGIASAGTQETGSDKGAEGGAPAGAGAKQEAKASDGDDGKGNDAPNTKPSDAEANLLRDVMKHKGRANQLQGELEAMKKQYEGVDAEAFRTFQAEKAETERKKLEDRGEYDRLVAQMGERHTQAMSEQDAKLVAANSAIAALQAQISEMTVGNSFSTSPVIGEELLMTRAKARAVYGAHFDFVDGAVVAFDKPKGASERTMLVTAAGAPMQFNEALMHLVNADPDPERDRLIRSKAKPGAASATVNASSVARKAISRPDAPMSPAERIAAGLRAAANKG